MMSEYDAIVLCNGYSKLDAEGSMVANCTCTLVKGPKNIIVDTMTPWDGQVVLEGLQRNGLHPDDIDFVVSTHGHADHLGNNNLFLKATHIVGFTIFHKDKFYLHPFETETPYSIDGDKVEVLPTPGHTLDSVTVKVRTASLGMVYIVGDLFEREEDIEDSDLWTSAGSDNQDLQSANRIKIIEIADHIIPGHGPMFKVTLEHRKKLRNQSKDH